MLKKTILISLITLPLVTFAQTASTTAPVKANDWSVKGQCISTAIDVRETAVITNQTTFNASLLTALNTRKEALKSAWLKTEKKERISARDAAWKAFKDAHKSARTTLESSNKTAWSTFRTSEKSCGVQTGETPSVVTTTSSL